MALEYIGVLLMSLSPWSFGLQTQYACLVAFYALFGFGVGGEYPISASTATELTEVTDEKGTNPKRGFGVTLTFAMQGVGAVFGSIVMVILLTAFNQGPPDCLDPDTNVMGYNETSLEIIWRLIYAIGFGILFALSVYRIFFVKESESWMKHQGEGEQKKLEVYNIDNWWMKYYVAIKYFWPRLLATGGCWFLWDVAFYGNKLFSGPIFQSLIPDQNLLTVNEYILLNNAVALFGYYVAACIVDYPWCGRRNLQMVGSFIVALCFLFSGVFFDTLYESYPKVLLFIYIFSSFWGQCGPNVITFITPTELFPTRFRATCHGLSAFLGKTGALVATIAFEHLTVKTIFIVCAAVCFSVVVVTFFFLPDVTDMDVCENDRFLEAILRGEAYSGELNNPLFLSPYEKYVQKRGNTQVEGEVDGEQELADMTTKKEEIIDSQ
eukprot:TRINITY_DN3486_c0_g1_i3.p1 TRINITY_DN3486_c0_g1~~TRINITY_DN3486_c0_g1_i3.p1  ORF type:complete len:437 (-),score=50.34 TRINITY_DN3486_c0_g1_i3:138-1448(-)